MQDTSIVKSPSDPGPKPVTWSQTEFPSVVSKEISDCNPHESESSLQCNAVPKSQLDQTAITVSNEVVGEQVVAMTVEVVGEQELR